jgi:ABC-2 type transport system permease protein
MDRGMISLKFAMLRNSSAGLRRAGWILGALLVVGTWAAAVIAPSDDVRHDVLALIFALWLVGGMLGPVLMSGAGVLRADYFALLPLSRAALGRSLLVSVFVGVAASYVILALLASTWHAASLSPATIVVAVVGSVLAWVLVISLSRLVYGALGAAMRTRLGIEIAGVQWGIFLAAMFAGWMMVSVAFQTVPLLLQNGLPDGSIMVVLDAIPTSWTLLAIEAATAGEFGTAGLWLAALLVVDIVCVAGTIMLLVPRSQRTTPRRARRRSAGLVAGGGVLPATPTGAVIMKELRQWRRDPWRALESSTAVWTGAVIGVFALLGGYTAPAGAFAGIVVAIMVALSTSAGASGRWPWCSSRGRCSSRRCSWSSRRRGGRSPTSPRRCPPRSAPLRVPRSSRRLSACHRASIPADGSDPTTPTATSRSTSGSRSSPRRSACCRQWE